jgi:hypothetical protein
MQTECLDGGQNARMTIGDRAIALGMQKITIMFGGISEDGPTNELTDICPCIELSYIERAFITQFPMSGLMTEAIDAGLIVWGDAANIEEVRNFLGEGINDEIIKAEERLNTLLAGNEMNPADREVRNADARLKDLNMLRSKTNWY